MKNNVKKVGESAENIRGGGKNNLFKPSPVCPIAICRAEAYVRKTLYRSD